MDRRAIDEKLEPLRRYVDRIESRCIYRPSGNGVM